MSATAALKIADAPRSKLADPPHPQLIKFLALRREVMKQDMLSAAARGDLFASHAGRALVNAMHDLTEVDGLYDLAGDIAHELRVDREGLPLGGEGA